MYKTNKNVIVTLRVMIIALNSHIYLEKLYFIINKYNPFGRASILCKQCNNNNNNNCKYKNDDDNNNNGINNKNARS